MASIFKHNFGALPSFWMGRSKVITTWNEMILMYVTLNNLLGVVSQALCVVVMEVVIMVGVAVVRWLWQWLSSRYYSSLERKKSKENIS
jgi:hypothetical protein